MRGFVVLCILFTCSNIWAQEDEQPQRTLLKPSPRKIDEQVDQARQAEEFAIFDEDKFASETVVRKSVSGEAASVATVPAQGGRGPASTANDAARAAVPKPAVQIKAPVATGMTAVGTAPTGFTVSSQVGLQPGAVAKPALPAGAARPGYTPVGVGPTAAAPVLPPTIQPAPPQPKPPMDVSSLMQGLTKAMGGASGGASGSGSPSGNQSGKQDQKSGAQKDAAGAGGGSSSGGAGQARAQVRSSDSPCPTGRSLNGAGQWQPPSDREMKAGQSGFSFNESGDVFPSADGQMEVSQTGGKCEIKIKADSCPEPNSGRAKRPGSKAGTQQRRSASAGGDGSERKCTMIYKPKRAEACRSLKSGRVNACKKLFSGGGTMELRENGQATPSENLMGTFLGQTGSSSGPQGAMARH